MQIPFKFLFQLPVWIVFCFHFISIGSTTASPFNDTLVRLPERMLSLPIGIQWAILDSLYDKPLKEGRVDRADLLSLYRTLAGDRMDNNAGNVHHLLKYLSDTEDDHFSTSRALSLEAWLTSLSGKNVGEVLSIGYHILAEQYWEEGDRARALEFYIRAFKNYKIIDPERFPDKSKFWYAYANRYFYFRDFKTAGELLRQMWNEIPDQWIHYRISSLNTIAICYRHEGNLAASDLWFSKAMEEAEKENSPVWKGIIRGNKAMNLIQQGNYEAAIPLMEENIAISRERSVYMDLANSLAGLSEIRLSMGNAEEAYRLIREAVDLMEAQGKMGNDEIRARLLIPLGKALMAMGRPAEGFAALDGGRIAQDSMNARRNALLLSGVQLKMEAEAHVNAIQQKEKEILQQRIWTVVLAIVLLGISIFTWTFFWQKRRIAEEQRRSESLLLNILPAHVAKELKQNGRVNARHFSDVTILFTDFRDFTQWVERHSADELVADLDYCFRHFDDIVMRYGLEKIKTIGDAYMAVAGLPQSMPDHALLAVRAALEIRDFIDAERQKRVAEGKSFFEIRLGLHSGPVVAGVIGLRKFSYDIWGDTVNVAARMESSGTSGKVNVSEATWSHIKNEFVTSFRGRIAAKNKGEIGMYFVEARTT